MTIGGVEQRGQHRLNVVQDEPTVSIVIPAKNEARNLPLVFAGLQTYDYEVILVDGNSTDDTVKIAGKLRPDIVIVIGINPEGERETH